MPNAFVGHAGGTLENGNVSAVMKAIFDAPFTAHDFQQAFGAGLST